MESFILLTVFTAIIGMAVCGSRLSRHMTNTYMLLKELEPELWTKLGQPEVNNPFRPGSLFQGQMLVVFENETLKKHPSISKHYQHARAWQKRLWCASMLIPFTMILVW
jgi:hypothetical protein